MKQLLLITFFSSFFGTLFGQYTYELSIDSLDYGSCTSPIQFRASIATTDPTNQDYLLKIYWEDGSVESINSISLHANQPYVFVGYYVTDTVNVSHQKLIDVNNINDLKYEIYIQNSGLLVFTDYSQNYFYDNSLISYDLNSNYHYDSLGISYYYDSVYFDIDGANNYQATFLEEYIYSNTLSVCPSILPFTLSLNSTMNPNLVGYNLPVVVQDSILYSPRNDYYTDFGTYSYDPGLLVNSFLFAKDDVPYQNSALISNGYNYYYYGQNVNQVVYFTVNHTDYSLPDTSLVVHIENPGNIFVFDTDVMKNPIVGNEFIEFQLKPGDFFTHLFNFNIASIDTTQLIFGDNIFKAYLKNTNDSNPLDDTTNFIINYWEPCQGNNSPVIDLSLNCDQYTYDSIFYYQLQVSKQTCQSVPGVQLTVQHPTSLTPDTSYYSYYNLAILNDSTFTFLFDFDQYSFDYSFDIPFTFNGSANSSSTLDFTSILTCALDTNGMETCGQVLDFSACNQIDTTSSSHYLSYVSSNPIVLNLQASIDYFNCNTADTLLVKVAVPNGFLPLSNNLIGATFANDTLTFKSFESSFTADFYTNQNVFGQLVNFSITYANTTDTTPSNNTAFVAYQMPPDYCTQYQNEIYPYGNFDMVNNQFAIQHFNNRSYCTNLVQEKVVFSSNVQPVLTNLSNASVIGDTLIFDVPDTSYYELNFTYNQFNANQFETFDFEFILSTDTLLSNNVNALTVYFPSAVCDTISIDTTNAMYISTFIAPLQSGHVEVYSNVLNCTGQTLATFELPSWITPNASQIPGAVYQNNLLTIPATSSSSGFQIFNFELTFPGNTLAGTLVDIPFTLSNGIDNSLSNNSDTVHGIVVNSYDPNEKISSKGDLISPDEQDAFVYEIHFQNDGNFPAYNIRVKDTIDTDLDLSSIQLLNTSHPCIMTVDSMSREVTFFFQNIMLAAYEFDSIGAQGVFQYAIRELPGVPNGHAIENTAYIFFDFNDPIVTNTTVNTNGYLGIDDWSSEEVLVVYPNPVSSILTIQDADQLSELTFTNMSGQVLFDQNDLLLGQLDVSNLTNGIYLIKARKNQTIVYQKVMIHHSN